MVCGSAVCEQVFYKWIYGYKMMGSWIQKLLILSLCKQALWYLKMSCHVTVILIVVGILYRFKQKLLIMVFKILYCKYMIILIDITLH